MPKEVIHRKASDNQYLHKDFHGALSVGLDYVRQHFGDEAVREYLRQFARSYYAPLTEDLRRRGLVALKEHFEKVYADEGGPASIRLSDDELRIDVEACPAVTHMRGHGYSVSPLFHETSKTVNEAICEGTPFAAALIDYDPQTGRGVQRFYRRDA
jgi:hypothetical protein